MTVPLLDSPVRTFPRRRRSYLRWAGISLAVVLLAVGAFLYFGPVGLGNGPLSVTWRGAEGTADPQPGPVGIKLPISTAGSAPAVIDGVDVVGGTRYPSPRVLASGLVTAASGCGVALAAARPVPSGRGFSLAGCGSYQGPLIGHAFWPAHGSAGVSAAAVFTAPPRGTCWVMTKVVVHYHVGGKHFSGAYPFQLAACLGVDSARVLAAMRAADGNAP